MAVRHALFCYPDRRLTMKKRMMLIINPMAGRSG